MLAATLIEQYPSLRVAPPIIAIVLAIFLKEVNFALVLAIVGGCFLLTDFSVMEAISKLCETMVAQVADSDHGSVILFTVLLGSMISLMNESGGTRAVVTALANYANTRTKGQVMTWFAGLFVFFDDYANTMLIGGSVRSLTDKLNISRAKLAFLVDATAAPIAGLALSTWTAYEIGEVKKGLEAAGLTSEAMPDATFTLNAAEIFLETIPYRLYPIIAIVFVGVIAFTGKDFGPMYAAERRPKSGRTKESVESQAAQGGSIWTAIIPVVTLLATVIGLLVRDRLRYGSGFLGEVNSYELLLITSMAASASAVFANLIFRRMNLREASESWGRGITSMIPAVTVLVLAWAISGICSTKNLDTAGYIISLIDKSVRVQFLPAIAFVAAGAMAVSIGSSFTTMGLLIPLFVPTAWQLLSATQPELTTADPIFLGTIGAILAGAIFGDHCSPISDTTVLSSAAAGCDHLQHVATQVPYALVMAVSSLLFGYLPIGFGVPWWIALPLSMAVSIGAVLFFGKVPDPADETT